MTFTVALGQPVHLLVDGSTDVRCGTEDVTYVSTNADVATCAACLGDEPEADDEPIATTLAPFELDVTTPEELRAWRKRHKLSQGALASLLGMAVYKNVYRWEKGTSPIPRTVSMALAYLEQRLP
jgi:DNA-binding transcriptional regulator YiaG